MIGLGGILSSQGAASAGAIAARSSGSGGSYFFDSFSAPYAAWSVRRLNGDYTGAAMRIREDGGDTEADIGFDSNGDVDTSAIASHCGSSRGFVTKWYGQEREGGTGTGIDATQTTHSSQQQIYNGTVVTTKNGKPALNGVGYGYLEAGVNLTSNPVTFSLVGVADNIYARFFGNNTTLILGNQAVNAFGSGDIADGNQWRQEQMHLMAANNGSSSTAQGYTADEQPSHLSFTSNVTGLNASYIAGRYASAGSNNRWYTQELIIWNDDESSDFRDIETDVNTYFSIY